METMTRRVARDPTREETNMRRKMATTTRGKVVTNSMIRNRIPRVVILRRMSMGLKHLSNKERKRALTRKALTKHPEVEEEAEATIKSPITRMKAVALSKIEEVTRRATETRSPESSRAKVARANTIRKKETSMHSRRTAGDSLPTATSATSHMDRRRSTIKTTNRTTKSSTSIKVRTAATSTTQREARLRETREDLTSTRER